MVGGEVVIYGNVGVAAAVGEYPYTSIACQAYILELDMEVVQSSSFGHYIDDCIQTIVKNEVESDGTVASIAVGQLNGGFVGGMIVCVAVNPGVRLTVLDGDYGVVRMENGEAQGIGVNTTGSIGGVNAMGTCLIVSYAMEYVGLSELK